MKQFDPNRLLEGTVLTELLTIKTKIGNTLQIPSSTSSLLTTSHNR